MISISKLGFGLSSIAGSGNYAYQERLIKTAIDHGITHFDVAPYYGLGDAETILGKVLKTCNENVTITTKFGLVPFSNPSPLIKNIVRPVFKKFSFLKKIVTNTIQKSHNPHVSADYVKGSVISSIDTSIKKIDRPIDIFLLHDATSAIASNPFYIDEIESIKLSGKVKQNGLSGNNSDLKNILLGSQKYYNVIQLENSLTKKADIPSFISDKKYVITHRAIQGGINELSYLFKNRPNFKRLLENITEVAITEKTIAQLLIEIALYENLDGCVLFSTTKTSRIIDISMAVSKPLVIDKSKCLSIRNLFNDIFFDEEKI